MADAGAEAAAQTSCRLHWRVSLPGRHRPTMPHRAWAGGWRGPARFGRSTRLAWG